MDKEQFTSSSPSVEGLGLSPAAGWYMAAACFFFGSCTVLALSLSGIAEATTHTEVRITALLALISTPFWLWAARRQVREIWLHVPVTLGFMAIAGGSVYIGDLRGALVLLFVLPVLTAAYLMAPRHAALHALAGVGLTAIATIDANEAYDSTRAVVLSLVLLGISAMVVIAQEHLRAVVAVNRTLAESDPLTGLANLRLLRQRLKREIARTERTGSAFALIQIDLDEFKQVNDRFSHGLGDRVLVESARAIGATVDPQDLAARRGGDEFSVVMTLEGRRDPNQLAAEIATAIRHARYAASPEVNPTASVAAVIYRPGESAENLLARADMGLHAAKLLAHPDRVHTAQEGTPTESEGIQENHEDEQTDRPARAPYLGGVEPSTREVAALTTATTANLSAAWRGVGLLFLAAAVVLAPIIVANDPAVIKNFGIVAAFFGCIGLWLLCMKLGRQRDTSELAVHIVATGAILTITFGLIGAGPLYLAGLDIYLLPALIVFYFAPIRHAAPYLLVSLGLYSAFLFQSDYGHSTVRIVMTTTVVLVIAALFSIARSRTNEFARINRERSGSDPLTRLANLRKLRLRIDEEIARQGLTLIMIDLDDFKAVNDQFSHTLGDKTLIAVAEAIEANVRSGELAARRGGDEFAVVATTASQEDIQQLTDRLSRAIADARCAVCASVRPTASIGYATWHPGESAIDLIRRADEALHSAKVRAHPERLIDSL